MEQPVQNETPSSQSGKSSIADEVKSFYANDFKALILKFFKEPLDGMMGLLSEGGDKAYKQALILFASVFALYIVGLKVLLPSIVGISVIAKMAAAPVIFMAILSLVAFGIKSISGKPAIKNELMTGGLCGIPVSLLLLIVIVLKMVAVPDISDLLSPADLIQKLNFIVAIGLVGILYAFLMLFNVFQQSLKAAKTNEAIAWYISPLSVCVSIYISIKVIAGVFA